MDKISDCFSHASLCERKETDFGRSAVYQSINIGYIGIRDLITVHLKAPEPLFVGVCLPRESQKSLKGGGGGNVEFFTLCSACWHTSELPNRL